MMSFVRGLLAAGLVALLAVGIQAEDRKPVKKADRKKQEKKPVKAKDPFAGQFAFPRQITLDEKQKEQAARLRAEYSPKLAELAKQQLAILTPARLKTANQARQKAYDAIVSPERVKAANEARKGKKGKEAVKAYQDALKLTADEQKQLKGLAKVYTDALKITTEEDKQLKDVSQQRGKLQKEINDKKMAILTAEQKEALKPKGKPKPKTDAKPKTSK